MRLTSAPTLATGALLWCASSLLLPGYSQASETDAWAEDDGFRTDERSEERQEADGDTSSPNDLWFRPAWGENEDGDRCYTIVVDHESTEAAQDGSAEPDENSSWVDSDEVIDHLADNGRAEEVNETLRNLGLGRIQLPEERCRGNDPEDVVEVVWHSELCPPPPPSPLNMDPDHTALTGMPGYLEIGGDNPVIVPCLGEEILATARYVIHWGDGHTTETTSQGGSYPDGDVRHTYADRGETEIVVEAYWRGEWNGIDLGEVANPTTDTLDLQVNEMQSVRTTADS